jgi:putative exosortase-associated protein (TIGR04073 family)
MYMHKLFSSLIPCLGLSLILSGCAAGPEQKLGRGFNNLTEITRMGEMRRSIEQATVVENRDLGYTTGIIHGFDRTVARTAAGFYEMATFPFPNRAPNYFGPVFYPENPVYPDSYKPSWLSDQIVSADTSLGFGGGDVAPFIPGSRFHVFDQ